MSESKKKMLETARERYKRAIEADDDNRKHALEVLKFRSGEHWDPKVKTERTNDPEGSRPCVTVDKTEQHLQQICNDERQNRPQIKVRPIDDHSDPEVAEVLQGLVRHIEDRSSADIAYDTGYEHAADAGFGYFRIVTEYEDPMSFVQDIRIKRIRNRFQVVLDPDRQEPDGSDARYGFVVEKMPKDEYEAQYGKEHAIDFDQESTIYADWIEKEHVLVAEYFRIEHEEKTICLWKYGAVSVKGDKYAPEMPDDKIVKERKTRVPTVKWSKINGKDEIDSRDWLGIYIPIVEVIGKELDIEGKSVKSGLLKGAMEPQRIHDYAASAFIENVALAPRAPWVAADGQLEGFEHDWRTANKRNLSVLQYKPIILDGVQIARPERTPPPGIPVGWQQTLMNTEHDVQAAMGRYDASLGADSNEKSGIALQKKQRESDTATFHYQDNLARSIRHCGRILLDLIPKIYDSERVLRILGEDGSTDQVMVNPEQGAAVMDNPDQASKIKKIYNLGVGKYDVTVKVGPAFASRREEASEFMVGVASAAKDPATVQIATYLAIKNSDMPGSDEAIKMLKKAMPPGMVEEEGQEEIPMVATPQGPVPLPQAEQMIGQLMQQVEQMGEQLKKAGDLQAIEGQVKDESHRVESVKQAIDSAKQALDARDAIAKAVREAQDARDEADRTKIVADIRMLVNDALNRMEAMKQQAEEVKASQQAEQDEQKAAQQADERAMKESDRLQKNDAIAQSQEQLLDALHQAVTLIAQQGGPRKRTPTYDAQGNISEVLDEPVMQ